MPDLRERREYDAKIGKLQAHLPIEPSAEPILQVEEASIQARDLFGQLIHEWALEQDLEAEFEWEEEGPYSLLTHPRRYLNELEDFHNSPFGSFLEKSLATVVETPRGFDSVELTTWGEPKYNVCLDEAMAFVSGDAAAAAAILGGYVVIDEMPKELKHLKADAAERAKWVRDKLVDKHGADFLKKLGSTGERNSRIHNQDVDTGAGT